MVAMQIRGVVVGFEDGFPEEDEGPVDVEAVGRPPFAPNTAEGLPSLLSRGAFHEAMLGGFLESLVTDFASGRDSHDLEPCTDRQPVAASCRVYYMGEGGGFPRVRAVVSLVVRSARGKSQHPKVSRNVN
jgi:hypothetical protein